MPKSAGGSDARARPWVFEGLGPHYAGASRRAVLFWSRSAGSAGARFYFGMKTQEVLPKFSTSSLQVLSKFSTSERTLLVTKLVPKCQIFALGSPVVNFKQI